MVVWHHIQELYAKISNTAIASRGISNLPKLKQEHISLTSYSRMWVDLVAQVTLVNQISSQLLLYYALYSGFKQVGCRCISLLWGSCNRGDREVYSLYFDRLFDCLNIRSLSELKTSRKPDR